MLWFFAVSFPVTLLMSADQGPHAGAARARRGGMTGLLLRAFLTLLLLSPLSTGRRRRSSSGSRAPATFKPAPGRTRARSASAPVPVSLPGFAVDLLNEIRGRLEVEQKRPVTLQLTEVTPANRLDLVAQHRIDIECGITTATWAREQTVDFSIPFFENGTRVLAPRSHSAASTILPAIGSASSRSSTTVDVVRQYLPSIELGRDRRHGRGLPPAHRRRARRPCQYRHRPALEARDLGPQEPASSSCRARVLSPGNRSAASCPRTIRRGATSSTRSLPTCSSASPTIVGAGSTSTTAGSALRVSSIIRSTARWRSAWPADRSGCADPIWRISFLLPSADAATAIGQMPCAAEGEPGAGMTLRGRLLLLSSLLVASCVVLAGAVLGYVAWQALIGRARRTRPCSRRGSSPASPP